MTRTDGRPSRAGLALVAAVALALAAMVLAVARAQPDRSARQAEVEARGSAVMPFSQTATLHRFDPTAEGGVQQVTVRDPADTADRDAIRAHLRTEAAAFARGDYADPTRIHGDDMPGVAELRTGAARIEVRYRDLPTGGEITYRTSDPGLVDAIHRWFDAQLADHGPNATTGTAPHRSP